MKQLPNNYPFQMYFQQACALMCVIYTLYLDRLFEYSLFQGLIQNWIQDRAITWGFICPWRSCIRKVTIFLKQLLLAQKAENLSAKSDNEAMELGSKVENQSMAALVKVCGKASLIIWSGTTCKFITSIYTLS